MKSAGLQFFSHCKSSGHLLLFAAALQVLIYASPKLHPEFSQSLKVTRFAPAKPKVVVSEYAALNERISQQLKAARHPYGLTSRETEKGIEIAMSVAPIFKAGSAVVQDSEYDTLLRTFEAFKLQALGMKIRIEVFTDPSPVLNPNAKYKTNQLLTEARAKALAEIFKAVGLLDDMIQPVGMGSVEYLNRSVASLTYDELIKQRRAVLYISK